LLELLAWATSLRPLNTATEGRLAVTAVTFERDLSHIVLWAPLLGFESLTRD